MKKIVMKKIYHFLVLCCLLPLLAAAQQKTITGKVTDDRDGAALPGVTVFTVDAAGKRTGVTTNAKGEYSLNVPAAAAEITFTYVGMITAVEQINGRSTINVRLTPTDEQLAGVVVVGYGTKRKETLTGAVSNITNKEIQTVANISVAQKLQGKVAGLQIRQLGGEPGTFDNSINIRGFGTPLFVIDGIVRVGAGEFQRLNADDIESISFLKDATAAIYGLRAANGVVIVTTKKGSKGKTSFNYTGMVGFQKPTDVPRMASAGEWMQMRNDADLLGGKGTPFLTKDELQKWIDGAPGYESTDWYNETMKKQAMQQQHNLSATGGNDKTQYFVSFAYANEEGLLKTNDMGYDRFNLRTNLTTELHKNLKLEVLIGGRWDKRETPGENFFNIFKGTRVTLPTERPYANNNPDYPFNVSPSTQNPVVLSDRDVTGYNESVTKNIQTTIALNYTVPFVEGLSLRGLAGYDLNVYTNKDVSKPYKLYNYVNDEYVAVPQRVGTASISNNYSNGARLTMQGQVNYQRQFAGAHNVAATLVMETQQWWGRDAWLRRIYEFYTMDQIDRASNAKMENSGNESRSASIGYLGRFSYDYKSKYLLDFAFREDGSYAYHPSNRWDFFPVVSAGWRISEEPFMKEHVPVISNLKFDASYGILGQDAAGPFQYIVGYSLTGGGQYEFTNGALTTGAASPTIVNEQLTWTRSKTLNIGMDLGLWRNKLTIEADVYRRDMEGIPAVRNVTLPNTFGASLPQENLNSARIKGIEFTLGHQNNVGEFHYGISGNFNFFRSMNLYVERGKDLNSWEHWRNANDYRNNDWVWAFIGDGQFQSLDEVYAHALQNGDQGNRRELPGDYRILDANNDGVINDDDKVAQYFGANGTNDNLNPSGKAPRINYGLSLNAAWKGFDLNVLFQGAAMYTVKFQEVYAEVMAFRGNTPAYFFDRWHKADPYDPNSEWIPGKWPVSRFNFDVGRMYTETDTWRKDASYVRLKSAELGYTIEPRLYNRSGISRIRVYANGFNLFTIADSFVKPFDPERLEGLFNAGFNYPLMRAFNFGVNVNF